LSIQVHTTLFIMKTRAFVEPTFKPSSETYSKSIRFPLNVFQATAKAATLLTCQFVGTLVNEVLLAFLKGELINATALPEIQPDNGKVQQLQAENEKLNAANTHLNTEISLYKSEIETLQRHYAQEMAAHTPAAHTQKTPYTPLHTNVHTSEHTPNTQCVQESFLAAHTQVYESAHTLENNAHTPSVTQEAEVEDNLRKIQELESEVDKILEEKDEYQNKLERNTESIEALKYGIEESFKFLCAEIQREYKIPLEPKAMHDVLNHFVTLYHEKNEISADWRKSNDC